MRNLKGVLIFCNRVDVSTPAQEGRLIVEIGVYHRSRSNLTRKKTTRRVPRLTSNGRVDQNNHEDSRVSINWNKPQELLVCHQTTKHWW